MRRNENEGKAKIEKHAKRGVETNKLMRRYASEAYARRKWICFSPCPREREITNAAVQQRRDHVAIVMRPTSKVSIADG